jgi:hypothetical protein
MALTENHAIIDGPGAHMVELALDRRAPEDWAGRPVPSGVASLLSGLLVEIERSDAAERSEADAAIMTIRREHNRHNCRQLGPPGRPDGGCGACEACTGYPECTHPRHFKDVAMMKDALRKCFLDQNPEPAVQYLAAPWKKQRQRKS